jgi:hypothetical protein
MNRRKGWTILFMIIHYYVEEWNKGGKTRRRSIFIKICELSWCCCFIMVCSTDLDFIRTDLWKDLIVRISRYICRYRKWLLSVYSLSQIGGTIGVAGFSHRDTLCILYPYALIIGLKVCKSAARCEGIKYFFYLSGDMKYRWVLICIV